MMAKIRFWLVLALLYTTLMGVFGLLFLILSLTLEAPQQVLLAQILGPRLPLLIPLALLLLLGLGAGLAALQDRYIRPLALLADDVVIMLSTNPEHRATPQGAVEIRVLAEKINSLATTFQVLQFDVQAKIAQSNRALAEEKNRLAVLMSELAQSVLVCNIEGRILLYNTHATELLETHGATGTTIGLGRSIFGVIERDLIVHALEQIQHQRQQKTEPAAQAVSDFVATLSNGQLVRAHMAAVLDGSNALDGFVLTLEDITRNVAAESQRDTLLQSLTQDTRAALANIRAALETMQQFPDMNSEKRSQFTAVIDDESQRLARRINQVEHAHADCQNEGWQLEQMRGVDLIALLQRRIATPTLRIDSSDTIDPALWLKIDSYALTQSLAYLAQCLSTQCNVSTLHLDLQRTERLAHLDLTWRGAPVAAETFQLWENTPLQMSASNPLPTLNAVIKGQGGESVYRFDLARQTSCYRLLLPLATARATLDIRRSISARPEFYDFNLFQQSGQTEVLDQQMLSQLSYTVFDTETTGLQPTAGDEIISLGALHIVNGRLLSHENLDQLIQPGRKLCSESIAIHGISDAMLIGQPVIEKVLPQFHRFAQDTILVAHNAAFDMRFLQMLEARTGISFTQPVLDTLLLSQVIHPHQEQHSLEAIANRLGVDIVGRHTALGDAIVTAEVLLKMIPLLAEKNIFTLKEARDATQLTPYARIHY
ncbi:MAG: DNA polymerase III subunit epsilon [Glaciimonas sp.]|nr:DNA polymerase III subunit epsilon [Glaciimonas sp.]